ncbi:MAG: MBL fold metallo-hydrolase [Acholeplasmataceae bacterium]|nr:MBL fold metallo-hydrolase [Acholeplasmataceae bacterium]
MEIKRFVLSNYQSNCYIVYQNKKAMIIDPGDQSEKIVEYINENNLEVVFIYATHGHVDHVAGIKYFKDLYQVKTYAPKKDEIWFTNPMYNRLGYDIPVDTYISEGVQLKLDDLIFDIYDTPGHSKGGTVIYNDKYKVCFSGDTLFRQTIGRTDLPFGNFEEIKQSILKMYDLFDDQVKLYPGHGISTTIGFEKVNNMYVKK